MSNILKGIQLNEVSPHNYDSDWDYQDAVARSGRPRSSYRSQEDDTFDSDVAYSRKIYQATKAAKEKAQRDADHNRLASGTNEAVTEGYPSDNDMGSTPSGAKMTLGQWKQMWMKKMPNADMSLFRFPPSMSGSAIAYFDGWVNNPDARWDPKQGVSEEQLDELSPETLASYKKKAGAAATAADKAGDYKLGNKRFSGIVKATKKQFAQDEKNLKEFAADDGEGGEEDTLRKYAKIWYNGDIGTQQQVEKILDRMGWEIGELESEEGGAFVVQAGDENGDTYIGFTANDLTDNLDENLHKWFKEKWVRFGPDGKIRGACARGDDSEGKPKCLPQSKAHSLGKKGRASAAARKRREDPNPERSGKAINVNTKKKSNESLDNPWGDQGNFAGDTPVNIGGVSVKKLTIGDIVSYFGQKAKILDMSKTGNTSRIVIPSSMGSITKDVLTKDLKRTSLSEEELDEACWKGYHKQGNKKMFGKTYPNCVKNTNEELDMTEGWKEEAQDLEDWSKEVNMRLYRAHESQRPALARQLSRLEQKHFGSEFTHPNLTNVVWSALRALQKGEMVHYDPQRVGQMPFGNIVGDDAKIIAQYNITRDELAGYRMLHDKDMVDNLEQFLKLRRLVRAKSWPLEYYEELEKLTPEEAWLKMANDLNWSKDSMTEEVQAKTDDNLRAYYAQRKAEKEKQHGKSCPHCGNEMVSEELMNEKKDACYYKVKSRYKVWPSAYASGALVKCRKKGASNWGTGGKSNESIEEANTSIDASQALQKLKQIAEMRSKFTYHGLQEAGHADIVLNALKACSAFIDHFKNNNQIDYVQNLKKLQTEIIAFKNADAFTTLGQLLQGTLGKINFQQGVAEDQLEEKWSKKYKDSINCSNPKGFSQKAHCAGKQKNESAIMSGLNQLDEGWKEKLGAAALAGSMALGAGAAHSRVTPDGQGGFTGGLKPAPTVNAPSDNKPSTEAPSGFSKEYLQKAADPNRFGRYMISVEKAQELLKNMP